MKKKKMNSTSKYIKARQRKKIWRNTVSCLVALVLFCTSYMLVRPAATMDKECGMVEHVHGDGCYDENGEVICPFLEHIHTADCVSTIEEERVAYGDESSSEEIQIDTGDSTEISSVDLLESDEPKANSEYEDDNIEISAEDIDSENEQAASSDEQDAEEKNVT